MLIEKKRLETDKLLREKLESAMRGLKVYRRLVRKYRARDEEFKKSSKVVIYLGAEEKAKPRKPVLIFQPDGYSDEAVYSLTCLKQLILTEDPLRIALITTNPDMKDYVKLFTDKAEVEIIGEATAQDLINYALISPTDPNFYIASLTQPYGRWGDRIVDSGMTGAEKCFAVGVYRVWNYRQERLPDYQGDDPRIHAFLERAAALQKESMARDLEARKHE